MAPKTDGFRGKMEVADRESALHMRMMPGDGRVALHFRHSPSEVPMKVVRSNEGAESPANSPLFVGTVHSKPLIDKETSPAVTVTLVRFTDGGRNKFHTHTADQILYITEGEGIIASEDHEHRVASGDIVHIGAGEVHWHGAAPGTNMSHLSILPPSETRIVE